MESIRSYLSKFIDPLVTLFLGFYYFNKGKKEEADKHFKRFLNMIENVKVSIIKARTISKLIGIRMFHAPVDGAVIKTLSTLSYDSLNNTLMELTTSTGYRKYELDVKVKFNDPEILRLLFGSRHCRMIYGDE